MKLEITPMPTGIAPLPKVEMTTPQFYAEMQEEGVRKMVSDHYDLLSKSSIRHLFPTEDEALEQAKKNAGDFFVQVLGGPPYFNENRGNPMMRKRHQSFRIDAKSRIVWLECYKEVLQNLEIESESIGSFWRYLDNFSMMMVNSD